MAFRLARLPRGAALVDKEGRPAAAFQQWWQSVVEAIEAQEAVQDQLIAENAARVQEITDLLVQLGLVEETADGALALAESAINPDGTIKSDKVLTTSMVNNAATVISSVYFTSGGAALGVSGSYTNITNGTDVATVSVANGPNALQQCFIDSWVGVRRGSGANEFVTFRCIRNDGTILAQTYRYEATSDQVIMPMAFLDPAPTASATNTYTIQANSDNSATEIREVFVKGLLGKTG